MSILSQFDACKITEEPNIGRAIVNARRDRIKRTRKFVTLISKENDNGIHTKNKTKSISS